ncbi:MAG TPA: UDP-N-acetylmuramoyl-L-alanine--D-glutamate ligase [Planctomycetes bacterium]|nr:UDP-N-acetylmuramoyl-L-alanine--D-glutamate ligase [Planctomycetota bacterium]
MRVTVMGLGLFGGGLGAALHYARRGDEVLVTDLASAADLAPSLQALEGQGRLEFILGRHRRTDFIEADLVIASPAVPMEHPLLEEARRRGVRVATELELFLDVCPAPVLAISGSNGKTTTCRMVERLLEAAGRAPRSCGNMGISLLPEAADLPSTEPVVLEISSFQLERLQDAPRFSNALLLPVTPNHLDRHGDFEHYASAKGRLLQLTRVGGSVVLDATCSVGRRLARALRPGRSPIWLAPHEEQRCVPALPHLLGAFNRRNFAAARKLVEAWLEEDLTDAAVRRAAETLRPLPHRMEPVGPRRPPRFVNDSKSTTPAAAHAAVTALDRPVHLIAGGADKGVDPVHMAPAFAPCASVHLMGATGRALRPFAQDLVERVTCHPDLEGAIQAATAAAGPGEVILLSPGHASYDLYRDYRERGEHFRDLARHRDEV